MICLNFFVVLVLLNSLGFFDFFIVESLPFLPTAIPYFSCI